MKVAFVGNCQAQILEQMVLANSPSIEVEFIPPVWLIEEKDEKNLLTKLDGCDWIFCQRVVEAQARFVTTAALKSRYQGRAISWPNAYFDGYFPGLQYLNRPDGRKVLGPIDEYHFSFIIEAFRRGQTPKYCAELIETTSIFDVFPKPIHVSLANLGQRETELDVQIADYLTFYMGGYRLFYTMNHPTEPVMRELMMRLLGAAGLAGSLKSDYAGSYLLNKIVLPFFPAIRDRYRLYDNLQCFDFKGVEIARIGLDDIELKDETKVYSPLELVECFYQCYGQGKVFEVQVS